MICNPGVFLLELQMSCRWSEEDPFVCPLEWQETAANLVIPCLRPTYYIRTVNNNLWQWIQ
jgi:hypothetical protein